MVGIELAVAGQTGAGKLHGSMDGMLVDRGVVEVAGVNAANDVDGHQPRLACHGVGAGQAVAEIHRMRAPATRMRRYAAQVRMRLSIPLRQGSSKPIGHVRGPLAAVRAAHSRYGKNVPGVIQDGRPPRDVARQTTNPHIRMSGTSTSVAGVPEPSSIKQPEPAPDAAATEHSIGRGQATDLNIAPAAQ
jgi:hypothetical protein